MRSLLKCLLAVALVFGSTGGVLAAGGAKGVQKTAATAQYKPKPRPPAGLVCQAGTYDPSSGLCQPNSHHGCGPGANYRTGLCYPHHPCPLGYHEVPATNDCLSNDGRARAPKAVPYEPGTQYPPMSTGPNGPKPR